MADSDDEREASRAYRGLPREEPPERLDDAIRAAARRETQSRPAPLVAPTGRRRWYFPVAAAAVVVLAVAVTSQVEHEQAQQVSGPALEMAKKEQAPAQEPKASPKPEPRPQMRPDRRPSREEFSRDRLARNGAPSPQSATAAPASPPPSLGASGTIAQPAQEAAADAAEKSQERETKQKQAGAPARALAKAATPESELERIAGLRRQGKDEEADRALAEFRKRYPDYRIAPEMLEKIEKK
jgi:hypothetical protein